MAKTLTTPHQCALSLFAEGKSMLAVCAQMQKEYPLIEDYELSVIIEAAQTEHKENLAKENK